MTTTSAKTPTTPYGEWIQNNINQDNPESWVPLTFRVHGVIRNAQNIAQSPWSQNPTQSITLVKGALNWTITELRRYHKDLQFISWIGGNEGVGRRTHIHAAVRVPDNQNVSLFVERLQTLWCRNLTKKLKAKVEADVWVDSERLRSGQLYSNYASRSEAGDLVRGMDKVIIDKSLFLEPLAS